MDYDFKVAIQAKNEAVREEKTLREQINTLKEKEEHDVSKTD